jgi:hypothetical protein
MIVESKGKLAAATGIQLRLVRPMPPVSIKPKRHGKS